MKQLTRRLVLVITLTVLCTSLVYGAGLPKHYPKDFQRTGVIDRVDLAGRILIVNDQIYYLSDTVVIHSPKDRIATYEVLGPGVQLGFKFVDMADGPGRITEIWTLPAGYNPYGKE